MGTLKYILLLALVFPAHSASWYVDNSAAGANDGTSWTDAWQAPANIDWGTPVDAGDTIYFSGGATSKTYVNPSLTVGDDGTSGSPILLSVSEDAGHNGTVVFDWEGANSSKISVNKSYIEFDGGSVGGSSRWLMANLFNPLTRTTAYVIRNTSGSDEPGFVCQFITFSNVNQGLRLQRNSNTRIHDNSFLQIRGDAALSLVGSPATYDDSLIHNNVFELAKNGAVPPGGSGSYGGPDGMQIASGVSVYDNTIRTDTIPSVYTSTQHQDFFQLSGKFIKIYNNEFVNNGDAIITGGGALTANLSDIRIYNNVFKIVDVITPYPEAIRFYGHVATPLYSIDRFYVMNNTFVDYNVHTVLRLNRWNTATPAFSDIRIQNNLFYNSGDGVNRRTIHIDTVPTPSSFTFSNNLYYHPGTLSYVLWGGTTYDASTWVASLGKETGGTTNAPVFTYYAENDAANDMHLDVSDTAARGNGTDLSAYFTTDKDGVTRSAWDIGAYEYTTGGSDVTPPVISSIVANVDSTTQVTVTWDTDELATSGVSYGLTASWGTESTNSTLKVSHSQVITGLSTGTLYHFKVQSEDASGNHSATSDATWTTADTSPVLGTDLSDLSWIQATNINDTISIAITNTAGGTLAGTASIISSPFSVTAGASYSLTNDQTATITVQFAPTNPSHYTDTLTLTGGGGAAIALEGIAFNVQPLAAIIITNATFVNGTTFYVITNGYAYQDSQELDVDLAARMIVGFEITAAGDYVFAGSVTAETTGNDSFYVLTDAPPASPDNIWDIIPLTTGFEDRNVNQRGVGAFDDPEFQPKKWSFTTGIHYFDVRGREADTKVELFWTAPAAPSGSRRRVPSQSSGGLF